MTSHSQAAQSMSKTVLHWGSPKYYENRDPGPQFGGSPFSHDTGGMGVPNPRDTASLYFIGKGRQLCSSRRSIIASCPAPFAKREEGVWTNVYRARVAEECMTSQISGVR